MLATGLNPYINAQGFASTGMFTVVIGAVTNILLDPLFIFTFGMGVRGAALATILSQILSAVFVLRFLTGKKAELRLTPLKDLQALPAQLLGRNPDDRFRSTVLDIAGLGSSAFVMQFTNSQNMAGKSWYRSIPSSIPSGRFWRRRSSRSGRELLP